MNIGEKISELRSAQNMSQQTLAALVGVNSAKVISNYEVGKNRPDYETLIAMCKVFHVSPNYFMDWTDSTEDELTADELALVQAYRELDDIGTDVVKAVLASQVERCQKTTLAEKMDITAQPVTEEIFLRKEDAGYERMKERIEELRELKKKAPISVDMLHSFLLYRGYNHRISILDLLRVFKGKKVPSQRLFEDIMEIMEASMRI